MNRRIVLVRHGPSAYRYPTAWVDLAGVEDCREAYDRTDIHPSAQPPHAIRALASSCAHIVSSDLLRALTSADRIAPGRQVKENPALREIPLPIPKLPGRLPLFMWEALIHLEWGLRVVRHIGFDERFEQQARSAVQDLTELADEHSTVLAVTHGVLRTAAARHLVAAGWHQVGPRRSYAPWSAWSFER
ncbi:MAG: histidine phosphatase family protein [Gemmatimonadota bacterium]